ncbi:MAG: response regulator transcription factor [Streptosporangiales bacterium]
MGINVLVVDQERTFADALAARLEAEQDLEVVAAVQANSPASRMVDGGHADVLLLDADLPDEAAVQLCEEASGRDAAPLVIMLSRAAETERIVTALRSGAAAWVCKNESVEHLLRVIRGVAQGEVWLPRAVTGQVLQSLMREQERQRNNDRLLATLSPREREILACLADGAGRLDVAERLYLSPNTVRTHLQNLMAKLGVHSTLAAVALMRSRRGLHG